MKTHTGLNWPVKLAGEPITEAQITAAATLVKRTMTAKHYGLAMYLRAEGATQPEVIAATGDTQVNAYADAYRSKAANAVDMPTRNGHKVYKLTLATAKARKARKSPAKGKAAGDAGEGDAGEGDAGEGDAT